mmetsp:Transcript_60877/g.69608  ORF Transcript_60877/g.69608 Transcript_60877/m.69608 type:complete len:90 (+) Transcript_60877:812-1081(+)
MPAKSISCTLIRASAAQTKLPDDYRNISLCYFPMALGGTFSYVTIAESQSRFLPFSGLIHGAQKKNGINVFSIYVIAVHIFQDFEGVCV